MPNDVKEMLGLPSKVRKGSSVDSPGKDRIIRSGNLTPRRLEKFEQHFKRRVKIKQSTQRMQARSPQQKCLHGGQLKKSGMVMHIDMELIKLDFK